MLRRGENVLPGDVRSFLLPCPSAQQLFCVLYLSLHCLSLSLYLALKLCLHLLPFPLLYRTLGSPHCPCLCIPVTHTSRQQPLVAFEVLTVVTGSCVWQGSPSKSRPSRTPSHTIWMAIPPRRLSSQLIGWPLSQWEAGLLGPMETRRRMALRCFSCEDRKSKYVTSIPSRYYLLLYHYFI